MLHGHDNTEMDTTRDKFFKIHTTREDKFFKIHMTRVPDTRVRHISDTTQLYDKSSVLHSLSSRRLLDVKRNREGLKILGKDDR